MVDKVAAVLLAMVVEAEVLVAGVDETTDELADEAADVPELDALSL